MVFISQESFKALSCPSSGSSGQKLTESYAFGARILHGQSWLHCLEVGLSITSEVSLHSLYYSHKDKLVLSHPNSH